MSLEIHVSIRHAHLSFEFQSLSSRIILQSPVFIILQNQEKPIPITDRGRRSSRTHDKRAKDKISGSFLEKSSRLNDDSKKARCKYQWRESEVLEAQRAM